MPAVENPYYIVVLLADIEQTLAEIYRAYARDFPEMAAFWSRLADDELRHGEWVKDLLENLRIGLLEAEGSRTNYEMYEEYVTYLQHEATAAQKGRLTLLQALHSAELYEKTYLEKNIIHVFTTESAGVQKVLQRLVDETERHYQAVLAELKRREG